MFTRWFLRTWWLARILNGIQPQPAEANQGILYVFSWVEGDSVKCQCLWLITTCLHILTGWWFGTCFPYIGNHHPDFHIFQRGWNHQPVDIFRILWVKTQHFLLGLKLWYTPPLLATLDDTGSMLSPNQAMCYRYILIDHIVSIYIYIYIFIYTYIFMYMPLLFVISWNISITSPQFPTSSQLSLVI